MSTSTDLGESADASLQETLLSSLTGRGPAEVFLRWVFVDSIRFAGAESQSIEHRFRRELALRVVRDGRLGFVGGSVPEDHDDALRYIRFAEAAALHGQVVTGILAPPVRRRAEGVERVGPEISGEALLENLDELTSALRHARPQVHWSGILSRESTSYRITNSGGLDVTARTDHWRAGIRARWSAGSVPLDALIDVRASKFADLLRWAAARIYAEIPPEPRLTHATNVHAIALGPSVLATMATVLLLRKPPRSFNEHVSFSDSPRPDQNFDDEGIIPRPLDIVVHGRPAPITTLCETPDGAFPAGRAHRGRIDRPPSVAFFGLEWRGASVFSPPKQACLFTSMLGPEDPSRLADVLSPHCVLLTDGQPVASCITPPIPIRFDAAMGQPLSVVGLPQRHEWHTMPALVLPERPMTVNDEEN